MDEDFEVKKDNFLVKIEKIRTSTEQEALQKKALRLHIKSQVVFSGMVLTSLLAAFSIWFDIHWYIWVGLLALALFLYQISKKLAFTSAIINKDQDRRFIMESIRAAEDIDELNFAGWFQYFQEMKVITDFDQRISDKTAVKEINRMRKVFSKVSSFENRLKEEKSEIQLKETSIQKNAGHADFFDASALVKIYVNEDGYEKVRNYFNESSTKYTTPFCFYEALSVLKGKRGKELTNKEYLDSSARLTAWYAASSFQIKDLNFTEPELIKKACAIVEKDEKLDLSDAFQILSVKEGYYSRNCNDSQTLLITADKRLAKVAKSEGLRVWSVLEENIAG